MAAPLVVTMSHSIGQDAAVRNIKQGIERLKQRFASTITVVEETWQGPHLDVAVKALGQTVRAAIDVAETSATISVELPWMLAIFRDKAQAHIEKQAGKMLSLPAA